MERHQPEYFMRSRAVRWYANKASQMKIEGRARKSVEMQARQLRQCRETLFLFSSVRTTTLWWSAHSFIAFLQCSTTTSFSSSFFFSPVPSYTFVRNLKFYSGFMHLRFHHSFASLTLFHSPLRHCLRALFRGAGGDKGWERDNRQIRPQISGSIHTKTSYKVGRGECLTKFGKFLCRKEFTYMKQERTRIEMTHRWTHSDGALKMATIRSAERSFTDIKRI